MSEQTNRIEAFVDQVRRRLAPVLRVVAGLVVLFVVVEVMAFTTLTLAAAINRTGTPAAPANETRQLLDVYDGADWVNDYYREFRASHRTYYHPYTEYRRPPFAGRYINIDSARLRRTVPDCGRDHADPVRVFVMGGSAAWGTGARDEATIPSHLARMLCERGVPATVTNYGESGYTNTQELIQLQLELRSRRVPDVVVFYDGVNDVYSSYQNRVPGLPQNVVNRMVAHETSQRSPATQRLIQLALLTNTGELAKGLASRVLGRRASEASGWTVPAGDEAEQLERSTLDTMLENIRVVRALEQAYGFRSFFYWQPAIYDKRRQSEDEQGIPRDSVFGEMYGRVTELVRRQSTIVDLSDVFDDEPRSVFVDEFHTSESANELIASLILKDVLHHLEGPATSDREISHGAP